MIPAGSEIIAGYTWMARRYRWPADGYSVQAIEAALRHAAELSGGEERDEPAALFFAFVQRPEAFPSGWRLAAAGFARAHAHRLGFRFVPYSGALDSLCTKVSAGEASFVAVRDWFRETMNARR